MESPDRSADEADGTRTISCLYREYLVALHGFIKKTRNMPDEDLATAAAMVGRRITIELV